MTSVRNLFAGVLPAIAVLLAPHASAQCQTSTGPDVIVGAMSGPQNYLAANGLDALAIGTTSCNIGTEWLKWLGTTNEHPVIGAALYRFTQESPSAPSRFEQIGISWLKHGFVAASETLCCASCSFTNGRYLGVGCSDPYTATRNGAQGNLGPHWEVDPHTGVFPFPPSSPPFSGPTARRLEVAQSDLQATSAVYRLFGESMYVTQDDAAAGNQDNNASWREMTYNPTNGNFGFTGATHREASAITAWREADPSVQIHDTHVPGNGLVVLACDTTDLGGGVFHYEYALYNMNSSVAIRAFTVPVASGVTITNIGFHDVTYRNGDGIGSVNFSDVDWTAVRTANALTWSTETFAQNPNANALRWSTTYNFRFDATHGPALASTSSALFQSPSLGPLAIDALAPVVPVATLISCSGGDGALTTPCPCAPPDVVPNPDAGVSSGCANSFDLQGGFLNISGTLDPDAIVVRVEHLPPTSFAFFVAGDAYNAGGAPLGDGIQCVSGNLVRFGEQATVGGSAEYPNAGSGLTTPLSALLGVSPGSGATRYFQAIYRNAEVGFCNPATINATNAVRVGW